MSQLIYHGGELVRISPKSKREIEISNNKGRSWHSRFASTVYGDFLDLIMLEDELLAQTSRGLYYSRDMGRSWLKRS